MKNNILQTLMAQAIFLILLLGAVEVTSAQVPKSVPTGAINGKFTINADGDQVYFSQGNLQYQSSTKTWRFAENQYDYVGNANSGISSSYSGWIDLFGWGTSGYSHGAVCYQPWSTSQTNSDYYAYGSSSYNLNDQTGQADWGYNPINNGGNQSNQWRSLTKDEWDYVFKTRTTSSGIRYAKANVKKINGVILLPDAWSSSTYSLSSTNSSDANYSSNTLTASQWRTLEQAGAVFLPAAGYREEISVSGADSYGRYWSASHVDNNYASGMIFYNTYLYTRTTCQRYCGLNVRLVYPAPAVTSYSINATPNPTTGGTIIGAGTYEEGHTCTLTATANEGYCFVNWTKNDVEVSTEAEYSFTVTEDADYVAVFSVINNIEFYDSNVKTICVSNWDTNGDGELSTIEAADVTSLGNVFKNNLVITSFDEFQYFTGLTSIGEDAFVNCSSLTSISIPNSVVSIGDRAFQNTGLVSIDFNNSLLSIGDYTFEGCGFTTVTLPNSLVSIGEGAFMYCTELTSVTIPCSVSQIGNYAFSHCFGMEQMTVSQENAIYTSSGSNAIIEISTNKLVSGCQNTVVPSSVVTIGQGAFDGCDNLTSIIIPNSVTTIGKDAFASCNNLASISLSENLESIGEMAFAVCENLTSLTIPSTVTTMGFSVFSYCSNLSSLTLLPITPPSMVCYSGYTNFDGINPDIIAYVPYESLEEYSIASGWNELTYFQPMAYRTVSGYGTGNDKWIFVSSPLAAITEPDTTAIENLFSASEYDLYRFNQAANGAEWENYKVHSQDFELENGQGYLYASKEDVNVIFKDVFNEETSKTVSLECSGNGNLKGFNLVGNPFPVNAYSSRPYYVMNADGNAVIATTVSTSEPIAPCTGILVRALENEVDPTVTFSTTQPRESSKGTINISLGQQINDSNTILDNAIVSFNDGDQLNKYVLKAIKAKIYIPQGGKDYAIAIASRESEMPINFKASQNGEYTITVTPDNVEMDYLHLIDNFTGVDVDLLQTSSYTFSAKDDDNASRFVLTFKAKVIDGE